jgi:hypothetical protein
MAVLNPKSVSIVLATTTKEHSNLQQLPLDDVIKPSTDGKYWKKGVIAG